MCWERPCHGTGGTRLPRLGCPNFPLSRRPQHGRAAKRTRSGWKHPPTSVCHPSVGATQHPAPSGRTCPPSPGCHHSRVNPWGGTGWEQGPAESVLVCQRSGYCRRDVPGLSRPLASSRGHGKHGRPFASSLRAGHPMPRCSSERRCNGDLALACQEQLGFGGCRMAVLPSPRSHGRHVFQQP